MRARTLVPLMTSFLLGCASTSASVREEAAVAAPASASGGASGPTASAAPAPSTRRATRLLVSPPRNWRVTSSSDGLHMYHAAPSPAIVRMALEPSAGTPEDRARQEAASLAARGVIVGPIEAGPNYASFSWRGDLGSGPRHGHVAVRRPAGNAGSLIVMSGFWPPTSDALGEEIGLLFLLASAE